MRSARSTLKAPQMERPVIFSGPMVRAILEGRKTQTRRIVKSHPPVDANHDATLSRDGKTFAFGWINDTGLHDRTCPYGVAGDRIWVRETTWRYQGVDSAKGIHYAATEEPNRQSKWFGGLTPSIHMPRRASRITLEITKVRVERLQDISEEDAKAEGMTWDDSRKYNPTNGETVFADRSDWKHNPSDLIRGRIGEYAALWDSLYGKGAWEKNPWVWIIEFNRHLTPAG